MNMLKIVPSTQRNNNVLMYSYCVMGNGHLSMYRSNKQPLLLVGSSLKKRRDVGGGWWYAMVVVMMKIFN